MKMWIEFLTIVFLLIFFLGGCAAYRADEIKTVSELYEPTLRAEKSVNFIGEDLSYSGNSPQTMGMGGNEFLLSEPADMVCNNPAGLYRFGDFAISVGVGLKYIDAQVSGQATGDSSYSFFDKTSFSQSTPFNIGYLFALGDNIIMGATIHNLRDLTFRHDIEYFEATYDTDIHRYNYTSNGGMYGATIGFNLFGEKRISAGISSTYIWGMSNFSYPHPVISITNYEQREGNASFQGVRFTASTQYTLVTNSGANITLGLRLRPGDMITANSNFPYFAQENCGKFNLHYPAEITTGILANDKNHKLIFQSGYIFPITEYVSGISNDNFSDLLDPYFLIGSAFVINSGIFHSGMGINIIPKDDPILRFGIFFGVKIRNNMLWDIGLNTGNFDNESQTSISTGISFGKPNNRINSISNE